MTRGRAPDGRAWNTMSEGDRFLAKIDSTGGPDACWPWLGDRTTAGYGKMNGKYVHRLVAGANDGQVARHSCDNPPCVNPSHLIVGTQQDNIRDMHERGRADSWGHKKGRTPMNTTPTNDTLILTDEQAEQAITNTPLPVFCYGTLRPGHGNDRIWHGLAYAANDGKCKVIGYRLVDSGFPYMLPAKTDQTFGCLIVPLPEHYDEVIARMDALEGVPHHYTRETIAVLTPDGAVMAWTYLPTHPEHHADLPEVWQNDWAVHVRRKHTSDDRWSSW